jgi:hypothetical protein
MSFEEDIASAMRASLAERPGGRPVDSEEAFREALDAECEKVAKIRKEVISGIEDQFLLREADHTLAVGDVLKCLSEYSAEQVQTFPLSEFLFYLRFLAKDGQALLFGIPQPSSPLYDTFSLLCEIEVGDWKSKKRNAWRKQTASVLSDMTACGHLADTLLETIYFGDPEKQIGEGAKPASVLRKEHGHFINSLEVQHRPGKLMEVICSSSEPTQFLVHVEINGNHVYILEIHTRDHSRDCTTYKLHSYVNIKDSVISRLSSFGELRDELSFHNIHLDEFVVMPYDNRHAINCLWRRMREFKDSLDKELVYCDQITTTSSALDIAHRVNAAVENRGQGVWQDISLYL